MAAAGHVFRAIVVLGVVRDVARALAVGAGLGRRAQVEAEAGEEFARIDHVLGGLGERHDLGLAGGQGLLRLRK